MEDTERSALLIIRAWRQLNSGPVIRVIRLDELLGGTAVSTVITDREELVDQVLTWFDAFTR
ncbi:hypothetical protein [Streptomyces sp. CA-106131]|uniref:hypothetical protein n=1 Tax=Streptomyces sp. CA-106131 TaxID=3240045 RepID=UPI003D8B837E